MVSEVGSPMLTGGHKLLATTMLTLPALALAHHSSAPHFDASKPISISGTVTKFRFVNPHAYVYLDVADVDGNVTEWNCEMNAASFLRRHGWTQDLFAPGTQLSIEGSAARRDPNGCAFTTGTLDDGTTIARNGPITSPDTASAATATAGADQVSGDLTSIVGTWITTPRNRGGRPGGRRPNNGPGGDPNRFNSMLTPAGKSALDNYDMRFDDPALNCSPSSIIRGWGEPNSVSEITVTEQEVVMRHEYMDTVRHIDLTTRTHPDEFERSLTGHSVGWFEEGTLVVDTVGFAAGVLLPHPGLLNSEGMHAVERFSLTNDGRQLTRDYEVNDSQYFNSPLTGSSSWTRTDLPLGEYNCTELSGVSKIRQ